MQNTPNTFHHKNTFNPDTFIFDNPSSASFFIDPIPSSPYKPPQHAKQSSEHVCQRLYPSSPSARGVSPGRLLSVSHPDSHSQQPLNFDDLQWLESFEPSTIVFDASASPNVAAALASTAKDSCVSSVLAACGPSLESDLGFSSGFDLLSPSLGDDQDGSFVLTSPFASCFDTTDPTPYETPYQTPLFGFDALESVTCTPAQTLDSRSIPEATLSPISPLISASTTPFDLDLDLDQTLQAGNALLDFPLFDVSPVLENDQLLTTIADTKHLPDDWLSTPAPSLFSSPLDDSFDSLTSPLSMSVNTSMATTAPFKVEPTLDEVRGMFADAILFPQDLSLPTALFSENDNLFLDNNNSTGSNASSPIANTVSLSSALTLDAQVYNHDLSMNTLPTEPLGFSLENVSLADNKAADGLDLNLFFSSFSAMASSLSATNPSSADAAAVSTHASAVISSLVSAATALANARDVLKRKAEDAGDHDHQRRRHLYDNDSSIINNNSNNHHQINNNTAMTESNTNSNGSNNTTSNDLPRQFACKQCGRAFTRLFNLNTHEKTHDRIKARIFACPQEGCKKSFTRKNDLQRHLVSIHGIEHIYKCEKCHKNFSRRDALTRHEAQQSCNQP